MVDQALPALGADCEALHPHSGRSSIAPYYLLRAALLQILYRSARSPRLLIKQIDYHLLFRWYIGLAMDDAVWHHSTFTKTQDRLLEGDIVLCFFREFVDQARGAILLADEQFSVDGALI